MYLYEKKIFYLSLLEGGVKKASAGFARVSREKDILILDIHIKSEGILFGRKSSLYLISGSREIGWGTITGQQGRADAHRCLAVQDGVACLEDVKIEEKDIGGILIRLDGQHQICGYWQEAENSLREQENIELSAAGHVIDAKESSLREIPLKEVSDKEVSTKGIPVKGMDVKQMWAEPEGFLPKSAADDKWEQLLKCYKNVHPFGDKRVFLSIELKDFIVLQAPYQKLVNNSFLLHGFYNYQHMILGPDKELGNGDASCFYLGVPGTYFEREKMVAIMFGFEGFECEGAVEIGKFGYYMRRVEL